MCLQADVHVKGCVPTCRNANICMDIRVFHLHNDGIVSALTLLPFKSDQSSVLLPPRGITIPVSSPYK